MKKKSKKSKKYVSPFPKPSTTKNTFIDFSNLTGSAIGDCSVEDFRKFVYALRYTMLTYHVHRVDVSWKGDFKSDK